MQVFGHPEYSKAKETLKTYHLLVRVNMGFVLKGLLGLQKELVKEISLIKTVTFKGPSIDFML